MAGNLKLLAGLAAGYVLGARAGRERYERIAEATRQLAERPEVRELTGKVRASLGAGLERAADTASNRLQKDRGEDCGSGGQPRAGTDRPEAGEWPQSGTGKEPLAEAVPPADEDHGRTPSSQSEAAEAVGSGREGSRSSPEPGTSTGRRERSRSGR